MAKKDDSVDLDTTLIDANSFEEYERLLRPYWSKAYELIPGSAGPQGRYIQFCKTRKMAVDQLANDTGILPPPGHDIGLADFMNKYYTGQLPIRLLN